MRRIAMLLASAGVVAIGLAGTPAQAEGWWDHHDWRHHEWREHEWREHHAWWPYYGYSYYYTPYAYYAPSVTFGFDYR